MAMYLCNWLYKGLEIWLYTWGSSSLLVSSIVWIVVPAIVCMNILNLILPPSLSLMSKLFRFSESLGKSNGKKWSQIWKLLLGVKSRRKKKLVFRRILPYYEDFLVSVLLSASVERCFVSRMRDFFLSSPFMPLSNI